ncbi:uncharacterized protein N7482_004983 [Penicillium canariense]|uniref:Structural maintenance of chromosomes protein 5 n=1 Tax=Penicillium canariense TaxID=189055 RepID=A0A9W9I743_9EURO|nr:uncharacterized protein N7482_004983 [Penicillium canariense]KAJ5166202.1 hypothetical protein N7482_004983 [Penicillium canariense]
MSSRRTRHNTVPRRRSRNDDSDDDSEPTDSSPASSSKRPRLSPAEEETGTDDDEDAQTDATETPGDLSQHPAGRPTVHREVGPGGFKPGAIVRIKVINFVTYMSAEFYPGPKLNMVIGPNGTGKSTLVCAICLGLGWGPQHLGRAKDLGEFVKHGCAEATIEIELAGQPKLSTNPVICRTIKRDGNKSSFTVNGRNASPKQVSHLVQSFAIQVDNLCQFLPQDKVAEFAALTPVELLYSTQRAAAEPEMTVWHKNLKDLRAKQKQLELENRGDNETLANLKDRHEQQRAEVENMRLMAVAQQKMELLEFCRPLVEYREYHRQFEEIKERKARVEREHEQLKADLEPAMRAVTAKQRYLDQIDLARDHRKQRTQQLSDAASASARKVEELQNTIKDLNGRIEAERKTGQKHKVEATAAQQNLNKLRRQQEEEAVEFDPDYYNEQLREKRNVKRELEAKALDLRNRRLPLHERHVELKNLITEAEREMKNLDSQLGQQEARLQKLSPETFKAHRWVVQNQDKFEKEVFGPPAVTCSITDPKYADAIESLFQRNDFLAFTAQTRNDFRTLQQALNGQLKLHDITIKTSPSLDNPRLRSPISNEELRQLGFDGWARDFINGPDPVIASLCLENRFSHTPISLNQFSGEHTQVNEMRKKQINSFVSGPETYQITYRAEYDASSTRVRQVRPARIWTSQPVDASLKEQHRQNIESWNQQREGIEEQIQAERNAMEALKKSNQENEQEMTTIEDEKAAKQSAYTQFRAIPEKIAQQEAKLKSFQELFIQVRDRVGAIRDQQDELSIKRAEATLDYADAAEMLRQAFEELVKAEIRHLEASSDLKTLKNQHRDRTQMLEQKSQEVKQVLNEFRERRERGRSMMRRAKQTKEEAEQRPDSQEVLGMINDPNYFLDNLNADIDSQQAQVRLFVGGNSNIIKIFEDREKQIERLETKLGDFRSKLAEFDAAIKEVRDRWEPRLDALIARISDAFGDSFARIGCAGQVSLDKVEGEPGPNGEPGSSEFDQWSIQIHVKFREHEQLSILDSHRQSGGERAVSTIFYLMALQSLSASPFRVVDEINQGMDPRNERMVHGRLVDIACDPGDDGATDESGNPLGGGGGGQYFLITPKLLSGLSYKPGMRVLCIYSGEHMPEEYTKLDFGRAIRKMKAINRQREAGTGKSQAVGNRSQIDVYG